MLFLPLFLSQRQPATLSTDMSGSCVDVTLLGINKLDPEFGNITHCIIHTSKVKEECVVVKANSKGFNPTFDQKEVAIFVDNDNQRLSVSIYSGDAYLGGILINIGSTVPKLDAGKPYAVGVPLIHCNSKEASLQMKLLRR